ncbi:MAG TPA: SDR family NAD(P)-dependent oxidoreductase [Pseudomonadales bacterium]
MEPGTKKTALITGASEGLGRAFASQLAKAGYNTLCIARNESRLKELVNELGDNHRYLVADLSELRGIDACIALMQEQHIALLVNNAGFSQFGTFREADIEHEMAVFHVNCHTVMRLSHAFLQQARAGDALINLSSITHYLTTPVQPTYCATKCFIASFSESLWYQERKRDVYVQALLPGITKTQFMARASNIEGFKMKLLDFISKTPESVVACSLKACDRRKKPIVIPGISNRLLALVLRLLPRKAIVWTLGKIGDLA